MTHLDKIVDFFNYCPTCEFYGKDGDEEPCDECLTTNVREHSRKPINYKEKEGVKKKDGKSGKKETGSKRKKKGGNI